MSEGQFRAVITRDDIGLYEVTIEHERAGWGTVPVGRGGAWTLKGARRKARRMLATAEIAAEYAEFREVITP